MEARSGEARIACVLRPGVARLPRNLDFVLAMLRSLLVFSVDRSHASSSGKLTNVASMFSEVVQSRLLDIAE